MMGGRRGGVLRGVHVPTFDMGGACGISAGGCALLLRRRFFGAGGFTQPLSSAACARACVFPARKTAVVVMAAGPGMMLFLPVHVDVWSGGGEERGVKAYMGEPLLLELK